MTETQICYSAADAWTKAIGLFNHLPFLQEQVRSIIVWTWTKVIQWGQHVGSVRRWTEVVGFMETVGSLTLMVFIGVCLSKKVFDKRIKASTSKSNPVSENITFLVIAIDVLLIFGVLSFIIGIVLLHGSYTKNVYEIQAWIVYNTIFTVMWAIMATAGCNVVASGFAEALFALVLAFCLVILKGVCIRIVAIHKKEIQASALARQKHLRNETAVFGNVRKQYE